MTIYDIKNINHCEVRPLGKVGYRVIAEEGWYIHLNDGTDETEHLWETEIGLPIGADFSLVEIRPEADLPEGAEYDNITEGEV